VEPDLHREIHERALVGMREKEKILLEGKTKKRAFKARTLYVSLDRADAIIEGGPSLRSKGGVFEF
jgi:hypothetical protein